MNSASPYIDTAKMFKKRMMARIRPIQAAGLISRAPSQYCMTVAAAEISAQSVIAFEYQVFQPVAKPAAGSMYRVAN